MQISLNVKEREFAGVGGILSEFKTKEVSNWTRVSIGEFIDRKNITNDSAHETPFFRNYALG